MCWCTPAIRTPWCPRCRPVTLPRPVEPDEPARKNPAPESTIPQIAPREAFDVTRRLDVNRMTLAEAAIENATRLIEEMPGDPRLTDAVVLLQAAQASVADFVDGVDRRRPPNL